MLVESRVDHWTYIKFYKFKQGYPGHCTRAGYTEFHLSSLIPIAFMDKATKKNDDLMWLQQEILSVEEGQLRNTHDVATHA